jgi:glycosyltransferase involved in cell wall biosynthesis
MRVSIITPCYNGQKLLVNAIHSVKNQTFKDWEYIIVNDGSTDDTAKIVQKYSEADSRIQLIDHEKNKGQATARNSGFKAISKASKYIMFLDHDDTLEPNAIEVLVNCLKNNPEYIGAHGLAKYSGEERPIYKPIDIESWGRERLCVVNNQVQMLPYSAPTTFNSLVLHCYISTPGQALICRSALERDGLFKSQFSPGEDWELWLRLSQLGPIGFVNHVVLNWYQRGGSLSQNLKQLELARRKIFRDLLKLRKSSPDKYAIVSIAYKHTLREKYRSKFNYSREAFLEGNLIQAVKQSLYAIRPLISYLLRVV